MNSIQRTFDPLSGPLPPRNRRRNPFWRFRRVLFVLALFAVVGVGSVLYAFTQTDLPEDEFDEIAQTSFICTAEVQADCGPDNATAILSTAGEDREIVTWEQIPPQLVDAVVATEDQDFFNHRGIDPRGITRAAYQLARQEGLVQGGSTITQQYVKLAFADDERNIARKVREAMRAVKLEQELAEDCSRDPELGDVTPTECAKQQILTRYLNRAYFGRGASGVQSAARAYFDKDVGDLTIAESAFVASLLQNPTNADPARYPEEANERRTTSLGLMLKAGFITEDQASAANVEPWTLRPGVSREGLGEVRGTEWATEYFVEEVRQQIDTQFPDGRIYTDGLRVYTTLDHRLQEAAYRAAYMPKEGEDIEARGLPEMGPTFLDPANPDDPSAALVSLDAQGRVVAMLGGPNFGESQFNLATSSGGNGRQPGSTFKPLSLALAIEQGISPKSLYPAVPGAVKIEGPCLDADGQPWTVSGGASAKNRSRDLIDALTWSSNIVFAELVVDIGPSQLRDAARRWGVSSDLGDVNADGTATTPCSIVLGSQGAPVIDMANVYSTFERAGVRIDPVLIDRIENSEGEVICWYPINGECAGEGPTRPERVGEQVLEAEVARQTNYAMTEVVAKGTGKRAPWAEDRPVAGKTGTSQLSRDGWFAGFTCDLTTVVWIGHAGESETPMIDFRKQHEDGRVGFEGMNPDGTAIDDRGWPNIEGGNFPTWIWHAFMEQATAGAPPCEGLEVSTDFTGAVMNAELSVSTLPPCGVQLDQYGYPVGSNPDEFVPIATTAPPNPGNGQPGGDKPGGDRSDDQKPDGLPVQEDDGPPPAVNCVPLEEWIRRAYPDRAPPASSSTTSSTVPGESTTTGGETTTTTTTDPSTPTTTVPSTTTSSTSTTQVDATTTVPSLSLPTINPPKPSNDTDG